MVNNTLNNIKQLINLSKNTISYNNIKAFIDYNFNGDKLYLDQDDKLYFDIDCQDDCPDKKLLTPAELANSYYMLLDTNKINTDIDETNFITSTSSANFEIESFLFNYASIDMCVYLYYIKFLDFIYENIYKNSSNELENITNDSLYDKIFEFNLSIKYIGETKFNVVPLSAGENVILRFKLNRVNIEKKNKNNLLKFIGSDNSEHDSIMDIAEYVDPNNSNSGYYLAFDTLISLISNDDLFEQLDIFNSLDKWRSNINVRFNTLYTKLKYILILTLQCYLKENNSIYLSNNTSINLLQFSQNLINQKVGSYEDIITELSTEQSNPLPDIEEKEHITNLLNKTHELKKINENIESKKLKISQMNKVVSDQQSKLNKINVVLVITIIMFIYLVVCLILYEYINRNVYISFGFLLLVSLIIYFYIYRLKKTAYIIAENFIDDNTNGPSVEIVDPDSSPDSSQDSSPSPSPSPSPAPPTGDPPNGKKQKVTDIYEGTGVLRGLRDLDLKSEEIEDLSKTYGLNSNDILTPLLNKEYKKYTEKNKNMNLHDKITKFNVNISKRDIKFTLETINYIINLSILFIVILFTISYNKYVTLSIGLVIFIILTMIYFVKIVRVIRTKSYNYYWDKPKNTVKKL